jgi:hypothetical protein
VSKLKKIVGAVFSAVIAPVLVILITRQFNGSAGSLPDRHPDEHGVGQGEKAAHPPGPARPETVTADGYGRTPEEALQDALRHAVRTSLETLVDAETLNRNSRVLDEKVVSQSASLVRRYEQIAADRQRHNGREVYHARITATIERHPLVAKLRALNIKVPQGA